MGLLFLVGIVTRLSQILCLSAQNSDLNLSLLPQAEIAIEYNRIKAKEKQMLHLPQLSYNAF